MRINILNFTVFALTTLTMFVGNLMSASILIQANNVDYKWMFLFVYSSIMIIIFGFININNLAISKGKILIILLWEIFIVSIFISKQLHGNFNLIEFILYSILVPLIFFSPTIMRYKNIVSISFIVSVIPFLYVLGKENTIGMLFCIAGILLLIKMKGAHINDRYIFMAIVAISFLVFITNSRTSLITFVIAAGMLVIYTFIQNNDSLITIIKKIVMILAVFSISFLTWSKIKELLFNKNEKTSIDITSGRVSIWDNIIKYKIRPFGSNIDYYYTYYVRDAHNTFIQLLADYGWISFLIFISILIYIIYKLIYLRKIEYILFFTSYFSLGMMENVLFVDNRLIGIHIVYLMYFGCLINEKGIRFKSSNTRNLTTKEY